MTDIIVIPVLQNDIKLVKMQYVWKSKVRITTLIIHYSSAPSNYKL